MTLRGLFLADGPSDLPLAQHLESLCASQGRNVAITNVAADRLGTRTVHGRLKVLLEEDPSFNIIFVHRDSEDPDPGPRYTEVRDAALEINFQGPAVAVVAVRMTEAWLLLDEAELRMVAGKPRGRTPLAFPTIREVERIADPKQLLKDLLVEASELSGRRLKVFRKEFYTHRRLLLDRLDLAGPVNELHAWKRLQEDISGAMASL